MSKQQDSNEPPSQSGHQARPAPYKIQMDAQAQTAQRGLTKDSLKTVVEADLRLLKQHNAFSK